MGYICSGMSEPRPGTPLDLAGELSAAASAGKTIRLAGNRSKARMGPSAEHADVTVSTSNMCRVLEYEPGDLTISVEAGLRFAELDILVAKHQQMVPLDPPFLKSATVGGVVAANSCGPRRRLYGSARDLVIGMQFATLEGKLVNSGGMVVKNAAGLDVAKLMVGSLGTLAAITVVNFRLVPRPQFVRTYIACFSTFAEAVAARDRILGSYLRPAAIDLLNPAAAARVGRAGYCLVVQGGGNEAVIERYSRELAGFEGIDAETAGHLWHGIREFTPDFLRDHAAGSVVRVSTPLSQIGCVPGSGAAPVVWRAGSGVGYLHFAGGGAATAWLAEAADRGFRAVIEFLPEGGTPSVERWPRPGSEFAMVAKIKEALDPRRLLNPGGLYGRL